MKRVVQALLVAGIVACGMSSQQAFAQSKRLDGQWTFEARCRACHGASDSGAPDISVLMKLSPEAIWAALTAGPMAVRSQGLSNDQKLNLVEFLGGREPNLSESGDAKKMTNHCTSNPPVGNPSTGPEWNGWGADLANSRFQPAKEAGLSADQIPQLKLKWAFGFPNGISAYAQPTVVSGRVYVGSDNSFVYSLNAKTGCVYWSFQAQSGIRNAITVGPIKGHASTKYAVYFGDLRGYVYALNAETGQLIWKTLTDDHLMARITAAPALYEDRIYAPVSSSEEATTYSDVYPCCTFRGSVLALDAGTGRKVWKTYVTPEPLRPTRKNSLGTQLWGPAGAAVWVTPTIDVKRHALYVGTGDAYTEPASKGSDAIVSMDLKTGKIIWTFQAIANDAWGYGCAQKVAAGTPSENCPKVLGPDLDFGASPILRTLLDGHQVLFAVQKNGTIWALDPDREGSLLWKSNVTDGLRGADGVRAVLQFGWAADEQSAYIPLTAGATGDFSGGIAKASLKTGERQWFTSLWPEGAEPGYHGQRAAPTIIPGAVLAGGWDGVLRAFSTSDGKIIWEYNTLKEFQTVNGVAAKGGSFGAPGPTVVDGMLYVGSGYIYIGARPGIPGNVLLAFGLD